MRKKVVKNAQCAEKAICERFTLSRGSIYLALKILFPLPKVFTKLILLVKISAY